MNLRKKKSVLQSQESQEISSSHNSYLNKKKSREEKKSTKNKYKDNCLNKNDENSKIDYDDNKHLLRNTETNFPGKYRKMNSGKYLYKTSKKSPVSKEKTITHFDVNIVKSMAIFFDKLSELEYEKLSKKKRNLDNVSLKFFSDDNFNSKLLNKSIKDSCLPQVDSKQQADKNDYPIMVNNSNIYYNFGLNIFPNSSIFNDLNKHNYSQINPIFFKNYDSKYLGQIGNQNNNLLNNKPGHKMNTIYHEMDKKLFPTYNNNLFKTTKDYIRKNTLNHISVAKYIKSVQDQMSLNENLRSEGDNQNIKKACKKEIVSKTSTESEKSEEKLSVTNNNEHIASISSSNLSKPFKYNVENMTKNQLNQIKEIVKGNR